MTKITITEKGTYKERDNSTHTYEEEHDFYIESGDYTSQFVAYAILHELQREYPDERFKIKSIEQ